MIHSVQNFQNIIMLLRSTLQLHSNGSLLDCLPVYYTLVKDKQVDSVYNTGVDPGF